MSTSVSPRAIAIPRRHAKPRPFAEVVTRTATSLAVQGCGKREAERPGAVGRAVLDEDDLGPRQMAEALDQQPHGLAKLGDLVVDRDDVA